jgi:adenylate cyclase
MKFTLRATLLSILLFLIVLTVAGLGFTSHRNIHFAVNDLSGQILDQTSLRIDQEINELLWTANDQGNLDRHLIESGQFDVHDLAYLGAYWQSVLHVHPKLLRLGIGLEKSGEWFYVEHVSDGNVVIGEMHPSTTPGCFTQRNYWEKDFPTKPFYVDHNRKIQDPRTREWYQEARRLKKQVWSQTYVLLDGRRDLRVPGVTCATPILDKDGSFKGVLGASFDLHDLCRFLNDEVEIGKTGYAFVVEFRSDGKRQVIAHPDVSKLLRNADGSSESSAELISTEELNDPRVAPFLKEVPADANPATLQGMKRISFTHDGVRYLGSYRCLSTRETPDWLICIVVPEEEVLGEVTQANRHALFLGVSVFAFAVLLGMYVSAQVARPLEQLARETQSIGQLHLSPQPVARSIVKEVDGLAIRIEEMKTHLRSFRKYVPADLVRSLISAGKEANTGGESRVLTIYFCDIANFTTISEDLAAPALVEHLGQFLKVVSEDIVATEGTVDKYIGDAVMAFWGAPALNPNHALAACKTALLNQKKLALIRDKWKDEGKPLFFARGGIHTGEVIVGNIGSDARLNYTVIGDAVNLASRMEGLNKYYGTQILITEHTYREVKDDIVARPIDWVTVKGRHEGVLVYELLGLKGEVDEATEGLVSLYSQGLALYRKKEWEQALEVFEEILQKHLNDGPTQRLLERCRNYQTQPLILNGNGAFHVECK